MRFTVRSATGQNTVETVTAPYDVRSPSPGIIELEYRWGRDLMEIRATQEDTSGRSSVPLLRAGLELLPSVRAGAGRARA